MFGLACKGLHCAGCGKGIPAAVVVIMLAIVASMNDAMGAIAVALYWVAGGVVLAAIVAPLLIRAIVQRMPVVYIKWDNTPMVTEAKLIEIPSTPQWPYAEYRPLPQITEDAS